jgi:hypothetical protein
MMGFNKKFTYLLTAVEEMQVGQPNRLANLIG